MPCKEWSPKGRVRAWPPFRGDVYLRNQSQYPPLVPPGTPAGPRMPRSLLRLLQRNIWRQQRGGLSKGTHDDRLHDDRLYTALHSWGAGNSTTLTHLPHYPCCPHRRFPWQRCIRALSSRSGRYTASCSDPVCISRCRYTNRGSHLVGETERMRRRNVRPRWGRGGAMQRGSRWASRRGAPVPGSAGVGEAGDACGCKTLAGAQMQTLPSDTDLCEGVWGNLPKVGSVLEKPN